MTWHEPPLQTWYNSAPGFTVLPNAVTKALTIVGDSITYQARDELHTNFDATNAVSIKAKSGERLDQLLESAGQHAENIRYWKSKTGVTNVRAIVNLGSNDGLQGVSLADYTANLARMNTLLTAVCSGVWFVTINTQTLNSTLNTNAGLYNAVIRATYPYIDWDAYVISYYAQGSPDGDLTVDGLHPTATPGRQKLIDLYVTALA